MAKLQNFLSCLHNLNFVYQQRWTGKDITSKKNSSLNKHTQVTRPSKEDFILIHDAM